MAQVVIENLTKVFAGPKGKNVRAVDDFSVTVADGELLVLVGPSGCGKSTTLRLIAGLEEITSGTISLDGRVMNKIEPKDRDIALVFQNHALYPHLTARENLSFGLKLRHHARADITERVNRAAGMLGLADCLDRLPAELSGGERQRVAVGRALVREPKVFLFDEPLSNLDAQMRVQMRREISALHRRLKATMIYVTHDQTEAMALGERIVVMRSGVVEQVAAPMVLYQRPANRFVAGFIGSPPMNFFAGTLISKDGNLSFVEEVTNATHAPGFTLAVPEPIAKKLADHKSKRLVMGLRSESITESRAGNTPLPSPVEAVVKAVEPLGAETHLYAATSGHTLVAKINGTPVINEKITLVFDMTRAHFFDSDSGRATGETT